MFKVIPAVDLKDGRVVHGVGGHRDHYQPIVSRYCASADPVDVVHGLREFYPFDLIYVADLDSISGVGSHERDLDEILKRWPDLNLWCDFGLHGVQDLGQFKAHPRLTPIAGTETLKDAASLIELSKAMSAPPVLSLDFKSGSALGNDAILNTPGCWPNHVIVLNLDHVGSGAGPPMNELERIDQLRGQTDRDVRLYAGGGVRHDDDLTALARRGFAGAVVATSLHRGAIGAETVKRLAGPQ